MFDFDSAVLRSNSTARFTDSVRPVNWNCHGELEKHEVAQATGQCGAAAAIFAQIFQVFLLKQIT